MDAPESPEPVVPQPYEQDAAFDPWKIVSQVLLFCLILGMAGTVDPKMVASQFRRMRPIAVGVSCQFILLPMCGGLTCIAFGLPKDIAIPLILTTTSPGGSFSNFWCALANADLALSVAMTTVSTVLAVVVLPVNVLIYMKLFVSGECHCAVPVWELLPPLGMVSVAVMLGLLLAQHFPKQRSRLNMLGTVTGVALITLAVIAPGAKKKPTGALSPLIMAATTLPCCAGLILSAFISSLVPSISKPERTALAIETCFQNTSIALMIAMQKPDIPEGIAVPLFYGVAEIVLLSLWALFAWKMGWTYAPPTDGIMQVLMSNYQKVRSVQSGVSGVAHLEPLDAPSNRYEVELPVSGSSAFPLPESSPSQA